MASESTVLIETHLFPSIEYFSLAFQHKKIEFEACENFQKGSYRNRFHIANSSGIQVLSIPLRKGKNEKQPIRDVRIAYDVDWQKQHWQSIRTSYGSAPFWEHFMPYFEKVYSKKYEFLFDMNVEVIEIFFKILKLNKTTQTSFSTEYLLPYTEGVDFRNKITPKSNDFKCQPYLQLFQDRNGFIPNLSALDLVMCTGPQALEILQNSSY